MDILMIGVILVFFGVVVLVGSKVMSEVNSQLQNLDIIPTDSKEVSQRMTDYYPGIIDNSFLMLTVGLGIITLILAAMVRIHPIFIPIFLIFFIFLIFLSGVFSNIYQKMAENSEFASIASDLTMTTHILTYLPIIVGIFGTLLMIIMYKNYQEAQ